MAYSWETLWCNACDVPYNVPMGKKYQHNCQANNGGYIKFEERLEMSPKLAYARKQISKHLAQIETYFRGHREVTLCVRCPGEPEQDFLLTSEKDMDAVIALLERSKAREEQ